MKKHLIAAAVASAIALPVMAQNVTVYGILDVGATDRETDRKGSTVVKQRSTGNTSAYTTSRLGFRGEEDLGGGLKAGFNYELGLAQNDAAQQTSSNLPTGVTAPVSVDSNYGNTMITNQLRIAAVYLSGGFGTVSLGRQGTAVEGAWGVGDVGGANNMWGRAYTLGGGMLSGSLATDRALGKQNNDRSDRIVQYRSPSFSGVTVTLQYGEGEAQSAQFTTNTKGKEQGVLISYSAGPLNAAYGFQKEKYSSAASVVPLNGQPEQQVLGFNYDLKVAKVFGLHAVSENKDAAGLKIDDRSVSELGLSFPMGAVTLNGSYLNGSYKANPTSNKSDLSGYQLAALYNLSKRTMAYAVYGSETTEGGTLGVGVTKIERSNFGVGIRHMF